MRTGRRYRSTQRIITARERAENNTILALWTVRSLLYTGHWRELSRNYFESHAWSAAGLESPGEDDEAGLEERLYRRLEALESSQLARGGPLFINTRRLGLALGLNAEEEELLRFGVVLEHEYGLSCCFDDDAMSRAQLMEVLGLVLALPPGAVRRALARGATLVQTGLLRWSPHPRPSNPLEVMDGLAGLLMDDHESTESLLRAFFRPCDPTALGVEDYPHVAEAVDDLSRLLARARSDRRHGVNVLLHGPSGVGKTELAKVLAAVVGVPLYAVLVEGEEDDSVGPVVHRDRLSMYTTTQQVLAKSGDALVLFDEIEDVLPSGFGGPPWLSGFGRHSGRQRKGALNRTLERNPIPAVWISNAIDHIDPAVLRRFDYTLRMETPPAETRHRIIQSRLGHLSLSDALLQKLAAAPDVTPADLDRAQRVTELIGPTPEALEKVLTRVVKNGLEVRGATFAWDPDAQPRLTYSLAHLNTDVDVARLIQGLQRRPVGTIGLFGPPGTGKTALVRHISDELGIPIHQHKASDLLGPYVGESEALVARCFAEAQRQEAILLIDEADALFGDRRGAGQRWEVSLVNELLVQLESFKGIFFCCSNLAETIDQALFRRLALKIRFDHLHPDQATALAAASITMANPGAQPCELFWHRLRRLKTLTPGDFAAVQAKAAIFGEPLSPLELVEALELECAHKKLNTSGPVGFACLT